MDQNSEAVPSVLIVEDEGDMARVLHYNLARHGYSVRCAASGEAALEQVSQSRPDLILLDIRLPGMTGLEVLERLRSDQSTQSLPVVIVSALGDEETVVRGLNLGADDYVNKPFRVRELMARADSALRRGHSAAAAASERCAACGIAMDAGTRETEVDGRELSLTRTEFDLLLHFVRHPGRVFTRHQLCHQALDAGDSVQERTIDAHIRTIRRKLGVRSEVLATVWGVGYRLVSEGDGGIEA